MDALSVKPDGIYLDATYGRGGHAQALLDRLSRHGRLLIIDRDPAAVVAARQTHQDDKRVQIWHASFADMDKVAESAGVSGHVDGILMDLGVSSPQLDDPARGFSFMRDGPLDMRMDSSRGPSAAQWLRDVNEADLVRTLRELGEEKHAKRVARAIIKARRAAPVQTTRQLATLVENEIGRRRDKHPATLVFQAIRMAVNRELEQLRDALPKTISLLRAGGRLVVVSFHSLEDRLVKRFMRDASRGDPYPPDVPVSAEQLRPHLEVVGKPVRPSAAELLSNPRARSAVMRVAQRTEAVYV